MPSGGWNRGISHSEATKNKIRVKALRRKMPEHLKELLIKLNTGRHHTDETKAKMSQAATGRSSLTDSGRNSIVQSNKKRSMEKSSNWNGGIYHQSAGYVGIRNPNHHRAHKNGYVYEHILIWEKVHGRRVPDGHIIHHLNGVKNDNRPQNLFLMKKGEHAQLAEPYKKRIRELEIEIARLKQIPLFPEDHIKGVFEAKLKEKEAANADNPL